MTKKVGYWKGKHRSEETKQKISLAFKGKTYEEISGIKKAQERKKHLKEIWKNPKYKTKMSLSHREKHSWSWKGGISQNYYRRLAIYLNLKNECCECQSKDYLVIHHIDENRQNNKLYNLKVLCRSCHSKIHDLIPPLRISNNEWIIQMGNKIGVLAKK